MAHFYGTVRGKGTTTASRLGTGVSGLTVEACSWHGKVTVRLYPFDGVDYARVALEPHQGRGRSVTLYEGPVSGIPAVAAA